MEAKSAFPAAGSVGVLEVSTDSSLFVCCPRVPPALVASALCHKSGDTCPDSCLLPKGEGKPKGKGLEWATSWTLSLAAWKRL